MKKKILMALGGVSVAAVMLLAGSAAYAHDTGHESRTAAQCEKLPGTASSGERGECLKCIARPVKHHFHPDNANGNRCRPDDGKP